MRITRHGCAYRELAHHQACPALGHARHFIRSGFAAHRDKSWRMRRVIDTVLTAGSGGLARWGLTGTCAWKWCRARRAFISRQAAGTGCPPRGISFHPMRMASSFDMAPSVEDPGGCGAMRQSLGAWEPTGRQAWPERRHFWTRLARSRKWKNRPFVGRLSLLS